MARTVTTLLNVKAAIVLGAFADPQTLIAVTSIATSRRIVKPVNRIAPARAGSAVLLLLNGLIPRVVLFLTNGQRPAMFVAMAENHLVNAAATLTVPAITNFA